MWEVILGRSSEEEWRVTWGREKSHRVCVNELIPVVGSGAPLYGGSSEKLCGTHLRIISSGVGMGGLRCVSIDNHPPLGEDWRGEKDSGGGEGALNAQHFLFVPYCGNPHIGAGKTLCLWRRDTQVFEVDSWEPAGNCTGEFWRTEGNGQDIWKDCHRGQPGHKNMWTWPCIEPQGCGTAEFKSCLKALQCKKYISNNLEATSAEQNMTASL